MRKIINMDAAEALSMAIDIINVAGDKSLKAHLSIRVSLYDKAEILSRRALRAYPVDTFGHMKAEEAWNECVNARIDTLAAYEHILTEQQPEAITA